MIATRFNWSEQLLAPLETSLLHSAIDDGDADWEFIDSGMIKFGSLTHASLDVAAIQSRTLNLLATRTKDFRLVVHLLRTLQHAGEPDEITLAAQLFSQFCRQFWSDCFPANKRIKLRLTQQVLQRFELAQSGFTREATPEQRDNVLGDFAGLAQFWRTEYPELSQILDSLSTGYRRIESREPDDIVSSVHSSLLTAEKTTPPVLTAVQNNPAALSPDEPVPVNDIDTGNDRSRKNALLAVADLLCRRAPENAVGYLLRRYAIWHTIQTVPATTSGGKTPLASVSPDRVTDYREKIVHATPALLTEIEQSLSLAPYWLDGHYLAAQAADRLGFHQAAQAIRQSAAEFTARIPALSSCLFSDMTPFISAETADWLAASSSPAGIPGASSDGQIPRDEITRCYTEDGLNAALQKIDDAINKAEQPRDRVYLQLLAASFIEQSGMSGLAQAHYQQLYYTVLHSSVEQWEPALLRQLAEKIPDSDFKRNIV